MSPDTSPMRARPGPRTGLRLAGFCVAIAGTELVVVLALRAFGAGWSLWAQALAHGTVNGLVLGLAWWLLFARAARRVDGSRPSVASAGPVVMAVAALAVEFSLHEAVASLDRSAWAAMLMNTGLLALLLAPVALWLDWLLRAETSAGTGGGVGAVQRGADRVVTAGVAGSVAVVAGLTISAAVSLIQQASLLQAQSQALHLAGEQRAGSQAIARLSNTLQRRHSPSEVDDAPESLLREVERLERAAAGMQRELDAVWPLVPTADQALMLFNEAARLRDHLLADGRAVAGIAARQRDTDELRSGLRQVQTDADAFFDAMDRAARALKAATADAAVALKISALINLILVVVSAAAVMMGVVIPVGRIIRDQQEQLRQHGEALERLTLVARLTSNGVVITDAEGRIVWVNDAFERLTGYPLAEARGRRPGRLLQCEDSDPATVRAMGEAVRAGRAIRTEVLNHSKDGRRYWLDIDIQPLHDAQGALTGFIAVESDITERIRITEELKAVLGNAAAGIVVQDADGRITDCNPEAERLLGLTREQMCGLTSVDPRWQALRDDGSLFPGEEHPAMVALRSGRPVRDTIMGVALPDGERRWLQVSAQPVDGRRLPGMRVVSSFTDISALRRAEAALSAERERLLATIEGTRAGTFEWNLQTDELTVNARWGEIAGLGPAALPTSFGQWINMVHPDDIERAGNEVSRHLAGHSEYYDCELRIRHADRRWVWVHDRGRVARWTEAGDPLLMYGTHVDIDTRVRATQDIEAANRRLRGLFDLAGVGLVLSDAVSGALVDCNAKLLELSGYRREEFEHFGIEHLGLLPPGAVRGGAASALETLLVRRDGRRMPVLLSTAEVSQPDGAVYCWTLVQDISSRKALERRLQRDATVDRLTGLANRALLTERLERAVERVSGGGRLGLLFMDFDRFKLVNDTLGHDVGDRLLQEIAQRLRSTLRVGDGDAEDGDLVARFGGDEFVVLLTRVGGLRDAERVANRVLNALAPAYVLGEHEIHSSASIGIVVAGEDDLPAPDAETLLRNADTAMYEAKRQGRGCAVAFNEGMHTRLTRSLSIEAALRRALASGQFELHYQPIVDLETGRMHSCEALLRWNHPLLGAVSPAEFVPIAEDSGLIVPIGAWVMREACRQLSLWRRTMPGRAPGIVSVNLSRLQMNYPDRLLALVQDVLAETGLPAASLQLEVTEREVMRDAAAAQALMRKLAALGVRLAMDDFGTGTSSLGCLREFPFDVIKIDRSFIHGVEASSDLLALIHATVTLVENLGMTSVAEGVESPAQVATLQSLGCRYAQGYLFSRPVPPERLLDVADQVRLVASVES